MGDYSYESAFNIKTFIGNVFMLQDFPAFNYLNITSFGSARPFWTLAVEWWIYLCFGYIVLVIHRKKKNNVINLILLSFFSIVPFYNLIGGRGNGLSIYWIFGSLIFFLKRYDILQKVKFNIKILSFILLILIASARCYITRNAYDPIFAFTLAIILLLLLLLLDLCEKIMILVNITKIIRLGASYSFTLYLIHYSIIDFMHTHYSETFNPYLNFLIAFIISNVISLIIGHISEVPLTKKIKNHLYKYA
ncbi:MAG: hypothetical protein COB15_03965 [Flavobacteriales bacterium]|nr:MAG: hypothetical protein COB15_03965 [Flavobacteriales bacterium]